MSEERIQRWLAEFAAEWRRLDAEKARLAREWLAKRCAYVVSLSDV